MLRLTFVTPEKKYCTDLKVNEITVPAYRGELNILPGHSPLMTTLDIGIFAYRKESEIVKFVVNGGYCEVNPDRVLVLAETVETKDQIDLTRAKNSLQSARKVLESGSLVPSETLKYQAKEKRALIRIRLYENL